MVGSEISRSPVIAVHVVLLDTLYLEVVLRAPLKGVWGLIHGRLRARYS